MGITNGKATEVLTGEVEATNPKGIRLGDRWVNFSQYAEVPRPDVGQRVRVETAGGWIKALEIVGTHQAQPQAQASRPAGPDREQGIRRLACLKAAAEFAGKIGGAHVVSGREPIKSADVLVIAETWEQWVSR